MKTAIRIRAVNMGDRAALFRLSEPLDGHEHVIVSSVGSKKTFREPETYIFGSDPGGFVKDWCELHGSFIGEENFNRALQYAGYRVVAVNGKHRKHLRNQAKAFDMLYPRFSLSPERAPEYTMFRDRVDFSQVERMA